jgi:beta-glucosidase
VRSCPRCGDAIDSYHRWREDNWEWGHWEPTFGLIAVDRATFDRSPKPSLRWLGALAPRRP